MSTQESLEFDAEWDRVTDAYEASIRDHAHTGDSCAFCAMRRGDEAKAAGTAAVKRDHCWWAEATRWLGNQHAGTRFTADSLVGAVGKPDGSPNQIGARLRSWAMTGLIDPVDVVNASRAQSHARLLRVWEVV